MPVPSVSARALLIASLASSAIVTGAFRAETPVRYDVRITAPEHHWMEVEIEYGDLPPGPLELRMSRSSPGRYALHEFAKNVFQLRAFDSAGDPLRVERPDPHGWTVPEHTGAVTVSYRIFGDRADGTYLQIDPTHAHMNAPATFVWARGLEDRPIHVRLHAPPGVGWTVATQLFPTEDPTTFTAPNLRYLLDSPIEFGETELHEFEVSDEHRTQSIRVALHTSATEATRQDYLDGVRAIVEEMVHVYGEYPAFDTGAYTFIADYLPWASGDGMEHRNSTILTSSATLEEAGLGLLGTVSHEFFHAWNVERIRPASLEPFDFERANMSDELWLAEGFTSYYGNLVLHRAGITPRARWLGTLGNTINATRQNPGVSFRSPVEMSRLAPLVDAARPVDTTYWDNTFLSYYTYGAAIAAGLDLSLRSRSDSAVTLDHYMRALWERFGRAPEAEPPAVPNPYTLADARVVLAEVSGDADFANDFFERHVEGTVQIDYADLLESVGIATELLAPDLAYLEVTVEPEEGGLRIVAPTAFGTGAYRAGLDNGDLLIEVAGRPMLSFDDLNGVMRDHRPGDAVPLRARRRDGHEFVTELVFGQPPMARLVPFEEAGREPTETQLRLREDWLRSQR